MATSPKVARRDASNGRKGRPSVVPIFQAPQRSDANPLPVLAQLIPRLTKREIEVLVDRLIEALDSMETDVDLEDDEREAEPFF